MPNTFTKAIISKSTAVWGGALARMTGQDDTWLGIPTGHMTANAHFGTSTNPDTSFTLSVTADDLLGVIWSPISTINVVGCKIIYGEGGATHLTHKVALMRYDIDADGDLSNGHEVGGMTSSLASDDYSMIRALTPTINSDSSVTTDQVLIAVIMCITNVNSAFTAKCVIEYTN
jgi:hypothetical protein